MLKGQLRYNYNVEAFAAVAHNNTSTRSTIDRLATAHNLESTVIGQKITCISVHGIFRFHLSLILFTVHISKFASILRSRRSIMITKRLVQPAYMAIRLMDVLNFIPVSLDLKTGKMVYEGKLITRILHYLLFYMSLMKCIQLSCTLLWLLMNFEMRSLHVVILTALMLSLMGTSTLWASELFHSRLQETIILFNSLEYAPQDQERQHGRSLAERMKAHARVMLSWDLQEFLCVMTPFAVKLFVPLYIAMMTAFPHWSIFALSLVRSFEGAWWLLAKVLSVLFEILVVYCAETNILFLFFFQLALQVTHLVRGDTEVESMR